jgi:S-adenosylmethionine:tRNA ribosyltransferase-isomerase
MKLSKFKFKLPDEQIAKYPSENRDECRLMVLHTHDGSIEHCQFKELLRFFDEKDLFVFNDTKVFPARLYGNKEKTGAQIEVFLLRELNSDLRLWDVLVEPARKIRIGNKLYFGENDSMVAEVIDNTTSRGRTVRFLFDGTHDEFKEALFALGETPLPRFIGRAVEPDDAERYQTIFAKNEGAVVAPMAGCHFSRELLKRMEIKGIESGFITLHASLSMFRDIDVEDLTKHKMDSEQMSVSDEIVNLFNKTQEEGHRTCAVGTTVLRALETASTANGFIKPYEGWTNKFIFPSYEFSTVSSLISNFQLPLTTMLMNTAAFGGYDAVMNAYNVAVKEGYQFGSYGDALLVIK